MLSDQEVICAWMERRPKDGDSPQTVSESGWWAAIWSVFNQRWQWHPDNRRTESLDALWEVEERLTGAQSWPYSDLLCRAVWEAAGSEVTFAVIHATPEQKIRALAQVLRPIVEQVERR
jgi:hypothetical protein